MSPFLRDIFRVVGMDRFFEEYPLWRMLSKASTTIGRATAPVIKCVCPCLCNGAGGRWTFFNLNRASDISMAHWVEEGIANDSIESGPDGLVLGLDRDDEAVAAASERLKRLALG